MDMERDIDWKTVEENYCRGIPDPEKGRVFPTMRQIAIDLDCDGISEITYMVQKAQANGWDIIREKNENDWEETRRLEQISKKIDLRDKFDDECFQVASAGVRQIKRHMAHYINKGESVPLKDLTSMGRALERFQYTGRLALSAVDGMSNEVMRESKATGIDPETLSKERLAKLHELLVGVRQATPEAAAYGSFDMQPEEQIEDD